ncbi:MAG TPA: DUF6510 family protein [Solirubrobacteraceae bacterium]|jgi:hypothetical protein|nr:DUF6510 family protein [Solirubrobacteraceae bacterium]
MADPSPASSSSEDYALDGNALAGLLEEVFAAEITTALRVCQSCGTQSAIGAHRAYRGAGVVLRCPVCRDLAMRIAELRGHTRVWLAGEWSFETPDR